MISFKKIYKMVLPQVHLNHSLRILLTLNTMMTLVIGVFAPFYAIYVLELGGDIAFVGMSWAVFHIVCGVLTLFFTKWSLRVREQELLLALGYIIRAVVFLSYAFMTSLTQLLLTQVLWGIAIAIGVPAFDSIYSAHTTNEDSIGQWGGYEGITAIAIGVSALVGGFAIEAFGFVPLFYVMTAVHLVLAVYIWRLPREVL
jgi:predicted MFS family arabinose efflux permease